MKPHVQYPSARAYPVAPPVEHAPELQRARRSILARRRPAKSTPTRRATLRNLALGPTLIALALLGGCDLLTDVEPLRSGVEFKLMDGYDLNGTAPGMPLPYLDLATDAQYGCMNYPLLTSLRQSGKTTRLEIEGVRRGGSCLTIAGPATYRTRLDLPAGGSTLVIRYRGTEDSYAVTVSDSMLEVSPAAGAVSRTAAPRTWRVPANTFAARCGPVGDTVSVPGRTCAAFHDSMSAVPGVSRYVFGAAAAPPSPPFDLGGTADERVYRYTDEAALAEAHATLQRVWLKTGLYLVLRTWRNEVQTTFLPD